MKRPSVKVGPGAWALRSWSTRCSMPPRTDRLAAGSCCARRASRTVASAPRWRGAVMSLLARMAGPKRQLSITTESACRTTSPVPALSRYDDTPAQQRADSTIFSTGCRANLAEPDSDASHQMRPATDVRCAVCVVSVTGAPVAKKFTEITYKNLKKTMTNCKPRSWLVRSLSTRIRLQAKAVFAPF